jgi:hypothetical protein
MFYRRELWIVLVLCAAFALAGLIESTSSPFNASRIDLTIESPTMASMLYNASIGTLLLHLIPLLASFPCACFYFEEMKNNSLVLYVSRTKPSLYYFSKTIVIAITAFVVSILPFVLNQLFCLLAYPFPVYGVFAEDAYRQTSIQYNANRILFLQLYMNHPLLNACVHIFFIGIYGAAMALLSYAISLFFRKNLIVALSATTIVSLVSILVFSAFKANFLIVQNYFLLIPLIKDVSVWPLFIELAVLLFISFLLITLKLKRHKEIIT